MSAAIDRDVAPVMPMLLAQATAQAKLFLRNPALSATSIGMPIMLFAFFGMPAMGQPYLPGVDLGTFMFASFAAYAVSSTMVFNFGMTIAIDRGQNVDVLMRSTPLPAGVSLGARAVAALAFGLLALAVLFVFAFAGGVRLDGVTWIAMGGVLLAGSIPFIALGFAIAYVCSPNAAPAVANLLYLVLAFGSGMLIRVDQMPDVLRGLAPYLPTYHYAQLAWGSLGASSEPLVVSLAWLGAYAVALFAAAMAAYQRETATKFA